MKITIEEFEGIEFEKYEILKKASKILNELEKERLEGENITALRKKVESIFKFFDVVKYKDEIYFKYRKKTIKDTMQKVDLRILYIYDEDYLRKIVESFENLINFFYIREKKLTHN